MTHKERLLAAAFVLWPVVLVDPSATTMADSALIAATRLIDAGTFTVVDGDDAKMASFTSAYDISVYDSKIYSGVGPGLSVLAAPIYLLCKPVIALFDDDVVRNVRVAEWYGPNAKRHDVALPSHFKSVYLLQIVLTWILIAPLLSWFAVRLHRFLAARQVDPFATTVVLLTVTLGSLTVYYGSMCSRQMLAALLVWHGTLSLLEPGSLSTPRALGVGAAFGLAVAVDYPSGLFVALALGFWLPTVTPKHRWFVLAPIAGFGCALAIYHAVCFGSPFSTPYHHRFWFTPEHPLHPGLDQSKFEQGRWLGMNFPDPLVMIRLVLGPYKGLLLYSPILALAAYGHRKNWRSRLGAFCIAVSLAYLLFNSTMGTHLAAPYDRLIWGGMSILWGPRHLLIVTPWLGWGLTQLDWNSPATRTAASVALGLSIVFNGLGTIFAPSFMSTPALAPELQVPVAHVFDLFLANGPRVPLLDVYGVSAGVQTLVLVAALVTFGLLWRRFREE